MTFADELRSAGASKAAVLHEFLIRHNPNEKRVHAFVEGYDDPVFYRPRVNQRSGEAPTFYYVCHGKRKLYEIFRDVTSRVGTYRHTIFFADKDLADILPETYPEDERIFVTDYYSIENHLACREAVEHACLQFLKIKNCDLPTNMVADRFDEELKRFQRLIVPLMAWIVCVRRGKLKPNLNNLQLNRLFSIDDNLRVHRTRGCLPYICTSTGVPHDPKLWAGLSKTAADLAARYPKTFVRGKFETWFLVEFLKKAVHQLTDAARACGGSVEVMVQVERRNVIALLGARISSPVSLDTFLARNFPR